MARDIKKIVSELTLEEKASLCSGGDFWHTKAVERLDIPKVMLSDGPHGLRKQEGQGDHLGMGESILAVTFPAGCATASGFDTQLVEQIGETLGQECQAEDLSVLLGPAVNIKRSPLCGRNFEYFSEDPYLTGKMAAAHIRGVQKWDVGTSIKHFACNNQEFNRMSCSSEVDERTLREIYLPGFEMAVKESQPKTIMCAYNKINGTFCAENKRLLTDILRDEWGFEGYVVTDWGAVGDRAKGIEAGLDLEMPSSNGENDAKIVEAVKEGRLDESLVDLAVERILTVLYSYIDHRHPEAVFDREADHQKAVEAEKECAVLLSNSGVLPLSPDKKVVYIGEFAKKPRYQGGGSSHINSSRVTSAWETAEKEGRNVTYCRGFLAEGGEENPEDFAAAVKAAEEADVAVIFAGLPDAMESEGYDRENMDLPMEQNRLIAAVAEVQPNTVVVLHNGSAVELPWADDVAAILEMYLGGQGVGEACDALLYGAANPCGHLAETWPMRLEDNPSYLNFPGDGNKVTYAEGVYVGYRYYEKKKIPVRFAFGHGLSYTTFTYSNLRTSAPSFTDGESIEVMVDVTNTGAREGKAVVQLYVSDKNGTPNRPIKELKGFSKVSVAPGETKTVTMTIDACSLSYYHVDLKDWYAPSGVYELLAGGASDAIETKGEISFTTKKLLPFTVNPSTTIGELMKDPRTAPFVQKLMASRQERRADSIDKETASASDKKMMESMMTAMPLKSLVSFGVMGAKELDQLIATLNQAAGADR